MADDTSAVPPSPTSAATPTLPAFSAILSSTPEPSAPLAQALSVLFEPSPILLTQLVPQVHALLPSGEVRTYCGLVDAALDVLVHWDDTHKATFVAAHPRIGEPKTSTLSALSAHEQGALATNPAPTPPEVLARLAHLNACYEKRYPGLRYITFVNGRPREAIVEEMEACLGVPKSKSAGAEPSVASVKAISKSNPKWKRELERAVQDVGKIAESRVRGMGLM